MLAPVFLEISLEVLAVGQRQGAQGLETRRRQRKLIEESERSFCDSNDERLYHAPFIYAVTELLVRRSYRSNILIQTADPELDEKTD